MKQIAFVLISLSSLLARPARSCAADAAMVEAAKKEGHVTWYTVQIVDQIVRPIISGFERKYGIHVDYVRANSAQLAVRLSNEAKASQVQASLFDGTGATVALKRENLVEKWVPDADLPKNLFDPEGYWVACNYYINTPGFNTDLVPRGTEPKTFEDLLDPKWKGKDGLECPAQRFCRSGVRRERSDRHGRGKGARLSRQTRQAKYHAAAGFGAPGSGSRDRRASIRSACRYSTITPSSARARVRRSTGSRCSRRSLPMRSCPCPRARQTRTPENC